MEWGRCESGKEASPKGVGERVASESDWGDGSFVPVGRGERGHLWRLDRSGSDPRTDGGGYPV